MNFESSSMQFRAACVQLCVSRNIADNLSHTMHLIRAAVQDGAEYVQTPEQTALMELDRDYLFQNIVPQDHDITLSRLRTLACELKIWLHIGSIAVLVAPRKAANRSFLINPLGEITATYDKLHMFDVQLPNGENYRESDGIVPGDKAVIANLPWGKLGLAICYDLRFPALFRAQAKAGAQFLTVPAAFTKTTGEAHWHVLLRARAIENGAYVFAAAQGGHHENGRNTYGHSVIISPWGKILAESGTEPCHIIADIDCKAVLEARATIPVLNHERIITF